MPDYKRARTDEQKEERMSQIKTAADELFKSMPYTDVLQKRLSYALGITDDQEYLEKELANALPRVQCLELEIEHMTGKLVNEA